ncbi:hypothetical protein BV20DRAFT_939955 [Pilatotrama ljubarskyi]|nr:hypothetical protein BV20DRAFT_939955 [Pilatotrama ljubarskyi]
MVRFLAFALALLAGTQLQAAPVHEIAARQIGDLQCNVDRLSIVADLAALQGTLKSLSKQVASDPAAAAGVQSTEESVSGAQGAIGVIAKALLLLQQAPAEARVQVQGNLTAAHDTLTNITLSGDSAARGTLQKALTQLSSAATAGQGVVANCK